MSECKHGLKSGCAYCHAPAPSARRSTPAPPRTRAKPTKLSEKMNDKMLSLKQRLKQIRGE
ncbi:MAG TPA: hypothetical protein VHT71_18305 [Methylomirabilota bacterium]|jgi:hypothetical protein|nr:hypothetical protein [Methylomirabilota bacterium]